MPEHTFDPSLFNFTPDEPHLAKIKKAKGENIEVVTPENDPRLLATLARVIAKKDTLAEREGKAPVKTPITMYLADKLPYNFMYFSAEDMIVCNREALKEMPPEDIEGWLGHELGHHDHKEIAREKKNLSAKVAELRATGDPDLKNAASLGSRIARASQKIVERDADRIATSVTDDPDAFPNALKHKAARECGHGEFGEATRARLIELERRTAPPDRYDPDSERITRAERLAEERKAREKGGKIPPL